jgi:hypothetical protein
MRSPPGGVLISPNRAKIGQVETAQFISDSTLQMLLGWGCIVSGFALFATLLRLDERRRNHRLALLAKLAEPAEPERDPHAAHWREIAGIVQQRLAGAEAASTLQAAAGVQIDAAEHAYRRLMDDFGSALHAAAGRLPTAQGAREPQPEPRSLAA